MPLATCPRCKRMFNKVQTPICASCEPEEEKDYERIRDVVAENPGASMEAVAKMAEVDVSVVRRMMDQGMVASTVPGDSVKCGRCGAPAISAAKKLCQACLDKMNLDMAKAQSQMRQSMTARPAANQGMYSKDADEGKRR